jgi:hypothetical protein
LELLDKDDKTFCGARRYTYVYSAGVSPCRQ